MAGRHRGWLDLLRALSTSARGRELRLSRIAACWTLAVGLATSVLGVTTAVAQTDAPPTYAGDLWSRPRLTGDWWGSRDWLAKHGVTLDLDFLQILQGVGTGGRNTGVAYDGLVNYELNFDTGKLGLWPGGFLKVKAFSTYGDTVDQDSGATIPVNMAALLPEPENSTTSALMNLTFTQFLTKWFGAFVGKVYTLGGDDNAFAHNFYTQFFNTALNFNTTLGFVPWSAYGGGLVFLPWSGALVTISVIDPTGTATNNSLKHLFGDGVGLGAEGRVTIKPFGLVGHQDLGFFWSNETRVSLDQDPSNIARQLADERFPRLQDPGPVLRRILERFFPELLVPTQPLNQKSDTWSVYYNFDQYLWSPEGDPNRGVGVFFRFGVSDGNPNPIKYAYNVGVSVNGMLPGRPRDTFGLGWARTQYSGNFVPFLRQQLNLGLNKEDAVELYYNAVVTPWLNLSADLQIVDSALNKDLNASGQLVNIGTAVVGGLRAYVRF
jgi:porin